MNHRKSSFEVMLVPLNYSFFLCLYLFLFLSLPLLRALSFSLFLTHICWELKEPTPVQRSLSVSFSVLEGRETRWSRGTRLAMTATEGGVFLAESWETHGMVSIVSGLKVLGCWNLICR